MSAVVASSRNPTPAPSATSSGIAILSVTELPGFVYGHGHHGVSELNSNCSLIKSIEIDFFSGPTVAQGRLAVPGRRQNLETKRGGGKDVTSRGEGCRAEESDAAGDFSLFSKFSPFFPNAGHFCQKFSPFF